MMILQTFQVCKAVQFAGTNANYNINSTFATDSL